MRPIILSICVIFTLTSLRAQTQQGSWELSFSGNLGVMSASAETATPTGTISSSTESRGYIALAARPGLYLTEGLVIEPELFWTAIKNEPPAFSLSANFAYNFTIPNSRVRPFLLVGYGIGNGIPSFERLIFRSSNKLDIPVLNAGAGLKLFVTERIALRTEYRFQRYNASQYSTKYVSNYHNVFFGFSVFFP